MWLAGNLFKGSVAIRFDRLLHLKRKEVYMVSTSCLKISSISNYYAILHLLSLGMLPHPGRSRIS